MSLIVDITFNEKYVTPIYGHLMGNTQIYNLNQKEQDEFKSKFVEIKSQVDDEILKKLLFDINWRFSLVSAWLIFSDSKTDFHNSIGQCLLGNKAGVIGYCYALSKFRTTASTHFLLEYLKKELQFDRFPNQKFQNIAYLALLHIDKENGQNNIQEISDLWYRFLNTPYFRNNRLATEEEWGCIENSYPRFVRMYDFIDSI